MKLWLGILFGHLLVPACALANAAQSPEQPWGHYGWGMMPWGMGSIMFMIPVMFILAIAVLFVLIFMVRKIGGEGHGSAPHHTYETPLEILKKRYARGEIDREEFERMKKDLEG